MTEPIESENPQFILPILCTHCGGEVNLAMSFALVANDAKKEDVINVEETDEPA